MTDLPVTSGRLPISSTPANTKESVQPAAGDTRKSDAHKGALGQKSPVENSKNMCAQIHVVPMIDRAIYTLNRYPSRHTRIS